MPNYDRELEIIKRWEEEKGESFTDKVSAIKCNRPAGPDGILSVDAGLGTDIHLMNPQLNKDGVLDALRALKILVEGDSICIDVMAALAENISSSIANWATADRHTKYECNNTVNEIKWE